MKQREKGAVNLLLILGVLLLVGITGWWFLLREPPLKPGEVRVTYEHGEVCRWQDWTFRVRRQGSNNRARGNMLITGPGSIETKDDTWLRVYAPSGQPLSVHPTELRRMEFTLGPAMNSSNREVRRLVLVTASDSTTFEPVELPKFSRSRVMVPVASRFFPDQSDDYMSWGNVRMTIAGTPEPDCTVDREISLTRPGHSRNRAPVLIEFGY